MSYKSFKEYLAEACNCWKGYKRKPGTKPCAEGSCVKEETNVEEQVDQLDELSLTTLQSYQAKRGNRDARMKTAVAAMDHILSKKKGEPPHQIHGRGLNRARAKVDAIRKKQTEMNPQKPAPHVPAKTGFRSGAMDDTYGT